MKPASYNYLCGPERLATLLLFLFDYWINSLDKNFLYAGPLILAKHISATLLDKLLAVHSAHAIDKHRDGHK